MVADDYAQIVAINDPTKILLKGHPSRGLYQITRKEFERQLGLPPVICLLHTTATNHHLHIHYLLGHASAERCAYECKCTQFPGLSVFNKASFQAIRECTECALAKSHRRSFSGHLNYAPIYRTNVVCRCQRSSQDTFLSQ